MLLLCYASFVGVQSRNSCTFPAGDPAVRADPSPYLGAERHLIFRFRLHDRKQYTDGRASIAGIELEMPA